MSTSWTSHLSNATDKKSTVSDNTSEKYEIDEQGDPMIIG